jgi:hypothetical protein
MATLLPFPPTAAQGRLMKEIKFRVHRLTDHMQTVLSCLEMGQHGKALIACREAVRDLENVDSELMRISRMPAERACASCLHLMASQSKSLAHRVQTQASYYRNNRWEVYLLQLEEPYFHLRSRHLYFEYIVH